MTMSAKIRRFLENGKSADYIAKRLGVSKNYVWTVVWKIRKKAAESEAKPKARPKPKTLKPATLVLPTEHLQTALTALNTLTSDPVNSPPHYKSGGIEVIDFIESKDLNYRLGNVVKYVSRAGKKEGVDPIQDLEKAAWYLKREIEVRKGA